MTRARACACGQRGERGRVRPAASTSAPPAAPHARRRVGAAASPRPPRAAAGPSGTTACGCRSGRAARRTARAAATPAGAAASAASRSIGHRGHVSRRRTCRRWRRPRPGSPRRAAPRRESVLVIAAIRHRNLHNVGPGVTPITNAMVPRRINVHSPKPDSYLPIQTGWRSHPLGARAAHRCANSIHRKSLSPEGPPHGRPTRAPTAGVFSGAGVRVRRRVGPHRAHSDRPSVLCTARFCTRRARRCARRRTRPRGPTSSPTNSPTCSPNELDDTGVLRRAARVRTRLHRHRPLHRGRRHAGMAAVLPQLARPARGRGRRVRPGARARRLAAGRLPCWSISGRASGSYPLRIAAAGMDVVATDLSAPTMKLLARVSRTLRRPVPTICCDAARVPLPDGDADTVTVAAPARAPDAGCRRRCARGGAAAGAPPGGGRCPVRGRAARAATGTSSGSTSRRCAVWRCACGSGTRVCGPGCTNTTAAG